MGATATSLAEALGIQASAEWQRQVLIAAECGIAGDAEAARRAYVRSMALARESGVVLPTVVRDRTAGTERVNCVQIQVLGEFAVMIDGEVLRRADSLPEMLLKYLAVVGGPCGVDSAARFLWPEQTLALARARLRNVLVRTKERFGPAVVRRAGLLMLGAHVRVDAFRLREVEGRLAAGRAVDEATLMDCFQAYRGHLLAGEEGGWLEPPRQALLMCHLRILDGLADFAARRGDALQEARWIEEAYRLAPYDDGRIIRLVRVLSRAGYHARARRAFELGCDVLTELGVRVPPQLLELVP